MQHVPNELVLSILEFWISDPKVTNNELRNTRLVSKLFDAFISPIVFKHLRLVEFNRDAFDNIANLSNSPIARFVKTFEYKTSTRISRPKDAHFVDRFLDLEPSIYPQYRQDAVEQITTRHAKYLAQEDVLGTYYDILTIARALAGFSGLHSVVISEPDISTPPNEHESIDATVRAFWAIIKALQDCEYTLKDLSISGLEVGEVPWRPQCLKYRAQVVPVLQRLTSLTLSGKPTSRSAGVKLGVLFVNQCRNLRHLVIDLNMEFLRKRRLFSRHSPEEDQLSNLVPILLPETVDRDTEETEEDRWVFPSDEAEGTEEITSEDSQRVSSFKVHLPRLENLCLKGVAYIHPELLSTFLVRHKATLKKLELNMFFLARWPWNQVFKKLSDELQLSEAKFGRLYGSPIQYGASVSVEEVQNWGQWLTKR